jgi:multidrug efflux pump
MRHAMGVAVFAGMIGVTLFGLLLTPVFFTTLRRWSGERTQRKVASEAVVVSDHGGLAST